MRRRALLSATAAALAIPFVAGCSRDDGGGGGGGDSDGGGGGGGPYGKISADSTVLVAEDADGSGAESHPRGPDGPALGPEPR